MECLLQFHTLMTRENVTQIYVATFNRAPDALGLDYWDDFAADIEGIERVAFSDNIVRDVTFLSTLFFV